MGDEVGTTAGDPVLPSPSDVATASGEPAAGLGTCGLAVASLVLGLVWLWWVGSVLALAFGYLALHKIKASGGRLGGRDMALVGVVLGWVGVATLAVLMIPAVIDAVVVPLGA